MSSIYSGINHFTFAAQPSGYGVWVTVTVATGGDPRNATYLMTAVQGVMDNVQFLAHRAIDIVSGGIYNFTSLVTIRNAFNFRGVIGFRAGYGGEVRWEVPGYLQGGATLHVGVNAGSIGHIRVMDGSDITVEAGGKIEATGNNAVIRAISGADIVAESGGDLRVGTPGNVDQGGTAFEQYAPHRKLGNFGYTKPRVKTLPKDGSLVNASEADIWLVPTGLAAGTPSVPNSCAFAAEADEFEFKLVQQDSSAQVHDFTVTNIGVFLGGVSGGRGGADVVHLGGGVFKIPAKNDGKNHFNSTATFDPYI